MIPSMLRKQFIFFHAESLDNVRHKAQFLFLLMGKELFCGWLYIYQFLKHSML